MADKSYKIFDAHFHIIDECFPLVENDRYLPDAFTCRNYLERMQDYKLAGGAIVAGSFQGFDTTYLDAALQELGSSFVGVAQLPVDVSDAEVVRLDRAGVCGVRFNLERGGSESIEHLDSMARRVYELAGWHVELYVDSKELPVLYPVLSALPAVSIDHLGLSQGGFDTLLRLVEKGCCVKATGFGRLEFNVKRAINDLFLANPSALMFGTDLPSTRAPRVYEDSDYWLVADLLGQDGAERVFYDNAARFYRLGLSG